MRDKSWFKDTSENVTRLTFNSRTTSEFSVPCAFPYISFAQQSEIETSFADQPPRDVVCISNQYPSSEGGISSDSTVNTVLLSVILPTFQDILPRKQIRSKYTI